MKKRGYWTFERCKKAAQKCTNKLDFYKKYPRAYRLCNKNKWTKEVCQHFISPQLPSGYWSFERCKKSVLSCKNRVELRKRYPGAYNKIRKTTWGKELLENLQRQVKPNGYWNFDRCKEAALECETKKEFKIKHPSALSVSYKMGWYKKIGKHFKEIGNLHKRQVYKIQKKKTVYIGLSYDPKSRFNNHKKRGRTIVRRLINNGGTLTVLTKFVDMAKAKKLEEFYLNKYKRLRFNVLNIARTGGLGSNHTKYNEELLFNLSKNYNSRATFQNENRGIYSWAVRRKLLEKALEHMPKITNRRGYWTKQRCLNEAKKYKTRTEFLKNNRNAYLATRRNDWYKEATKHMQYCGVWIKKNKL